MTASHRGRHAHHGLTGPGLPYTTLGDSSTARVSIASGLAWVGSAPGSE
jgi:hypothetical protein